jgi:ribonuclease VapC
VILDTSALIAVLQDEPNAEPLRQRLASAHHLAIAAPNWVELQIIAIARNLEPDLAELLDLLQPEIVAVDTELAALVVDGFRQYGKGQHPAGLNYGDCFAYALAKQRQEALLFVGHDFSQTDIPSGLL